MRISLGLAGSIGVFAGHHDIVKLVGSSVWIEAPETSIIWSWKPLDYHGWGWDCAQRDQQQHTCQRWSWDLLSQKSLNDEKSTFALKNVKESAGGLFIDDLGMSDNRRYLARHAVTGEIVESYDLKVGKLPSFPTDLQCVTLAKNLKMTCEWDMGLQSFLPWAQSETNLFFRKVVNITGWSDAQLSKLSFTDEDELTECPKYCTEGNIGCCEFQLTREDMNDGDLRDRVTFLMKVTSQNEFGKATMKKTNSEIISHSPTMNMKPLSPANLRAAPPNDYDGYSMIIKWDHDPGKVSDDYFYIKQRQMAFYQKAIFVVRLIITLCLYFYIFKKGLKFLKSG